MFLELVNYFTKIMSYNSLLLRSIKTLIVSFSSKVIHFIYTLKGYLAGKFMVWFVINFNTAAFSKHDHLAKLSFQVYLPCLYCYRELYGYLFTCIANRIQPTDVLAILAATDICTPQYNTMH